MTRNDTHQKRREFTADERAQLGPLADLLPSGPTSLGEMRELGELLLQLDSDDALLIGELEGYVTGVVCTPGPALEFKDWFPHIWGSVEAYEALDEGDMWRIVQLVAKRYHAVLASLEPGATFEAYLEAEADGTLRWREWCEGFTFSMEAAPKRWAKLAKRPTNDAFQILAGLILTAGDTMTPEDSAEAGRNAPMMIPQLVRGLYDFNRQKAGAGPGPYHKTGRNDPCPCGSGKKFKKCHGVQD